MEAFAIVQLVGASIALVVGAIVFLVVFFRGMSWLDRWIKVRSDTATRRSGVKRRKRPERSVSSDWDSFVREPKSARTEVRKLSPSKMHATKSETLPSDTATESDVSSEGSESVTKSVNRIATVHLMSGEIMDRVAFCARDRVTKICDRLGLEGVVFENDEGQIWVVRESNIKMVTWKTNQSVLT